MVRGWLDRLGAGRWGSVRLALVLAVPTLPVVAWALANPKISDPFFNPTPPMRVVLPIAVAAVLAAAIAGGFVGGRLAHRPTLSVFAAMAVAWFAGMLSLSLVPALLGMNYVGAVFCIDGCQPLVTAEKPISGGIAFASGVGMSTVLIAPPLVAIALVAFSRRLARRGRLVAASVLVVAAQAAAQFMTFVGGGVPAVVVFLCLGAGIVAWSSVIVSAPELVIPTETEPAPSPA